ncbi:ester cyclase [Aquisalimonas sp.]|uniref:ester cyclase n=1 Tax=Aquisalimonas sp. TaxID=1872621 RepID=UPI0025BADD99|nr:ester cyclase [Aquisalimonas sp.]
MSSIMDTAGKFLDACDTGRGWDVCQQYCHADATFAAQAEPLADIDTLEGYTNWMQGLFDALPDGCYEIKSLAVDNERDNVCAYAVFRGTHTGEGGPVPPTGRSTDSQFVYVMEFEHGRIRHVTKVWNASYAMGQLGWM